MRTKVVLLILAVFAMLLPPEAFGSHTRLCDADNMKISLRLNRSEYTSSHTVKMKMVLVNKGEDCTMRWQSGQTHEFYVYDGGRKIWRSDACREFSQRIHEEEWDHGHREIYKANWRQHRSNRRERDDCEGAKVSTGRYRAEGHFKGGGKRRTGQLAFRIVNG